MSSHSLSQRSGAAWMETLEARQLLAFAALVNFQPKNAPVPSGYVKDFGAVFADHGNGLTYGWNDTNNNAIDRNSKRSPNQAYDTFNQTQKNGSFVWEIAVPNGTYEVRAVAGDASSTSGFYHFLAEGQNLVSGRPSIFNRWITGNKTITVTDGRLTLSNGSSASGNKINFIEVRQSVSVAVPAAPNTLNVTAVGPRQIDLTWKDNSVNEDGFVVERKLSGTSNSTFQEIATLPANTTSLSDTGLSPDTGYAYRVRAFNAAGPSAYTSIQLATTPSDPVLAPAGPTDLTLLSLVGSTATISWTDNSDNEEKFLIQAGWNGTAFSTRKEVPANTTTTTISLGTGVVQDLRVVAHNTAGGSSTPSNVITVTIPPEAPFNLTAQAVSSSAIDLFWDSTDSFEFHIERLNNDTGQWERIASDFFGTGYRDSGLMPGTTYFYRVLAIAVNSAGDSAPSNVASATTAFQ